MYCTMPVKVETQRRGLRSSSSTWTGGFLVLMMILLITDHGDNGDL